MLRFTKYSIIIISISICYNLGFSQVVISTSNLPLVVINTNGQVIPDEPKIVVDMGIIYNGPGEINNINDNFNNYNGKIAIEIRGYTSQTFEKKSYSFETQDISGFNLNVSLIDLPEENDWVLYGPYADKSLMRNVLSYELSRRMGGYAPRTKYCELILNDEYMGVYVLTEKIKRDKNRVDIAKLTENDTIGDDLTGGYILQVDRAQEPGWYSVFNDKKFFTNIYPGDDILDVQNDYIQNFIYNVELNFDNLNNTNDTTIGEIIDINSYADFTIINELAKNVDAYRLSTYMYKDKDSKDGRLKMGPVWDFNIAYGNNLNYLAYTTPNFIYNDTTFEDITLFWFRKLMSETFFTNNIRCRWDDLRTNILSDNSVSNLIDSCSNFLNEAQERNFEKWDILGHNVWPNYYVGDTYPEEITILKDWLISRLQWIDRNLPGDCNNFENDILPNEVLIYPNPFDSELNIEVNKNISGNINFHLFDLKGCQILQISLNNNPRTHIISKEISNLANGFYLYNLVIDNSFVRNGKLIKVQ